MQHQDPSSMKMSALGAFPSPTRLHNGPSAGVPRKVRAADCRPAIHRPLHSTHPSPCASSSPATRSVQKWQTRPPQPQTSPRTASTKRNRGTMVLESRRAIFRRSTRSTSAPSPVAHSQEAKHARYCHSQLKSPNQEHHDDDIVHEELIEISLGKSDVSNVDGTLKETTLTDVELVEQLMESAKSGELGAFRRVCACVTKSQLQLDAPGYMGWTAAHWAAREGHVELLEHLVALHANLDAVDHKGDSLLHKAAANGQHQACQWLLARGFNVRVRNNNGLTPLDLAQERVAVSGRGSASACLCEMILSHEYANTF